jgi:TrmH family RNA methyltransferase
MITKNEVKYIQSLADQKSRNDTSCFLAEGVRLVDDLLVHCPEQIAEVFCTDDYINEQILLHPNISIKRITDLELARISQMQTPNQVLAVVRKFHFKLPERASKQWMLALDGIQDPGNMGTIIRLADWFGIRHIFCSKDCVAVYNPKVVQSTMGSIARVAVHYVNLKDIVADYRLPLIVATMTGTSLQSFQFPEGGMITIGNEGKGIRQEIENILSHRVTIPSFGGAESLNAAIATGIILWELRRR